MSLRLPRAYNEGMGFSGFTAALFLVEPCYLSLLAEEEDDGCRGRALLVEDCPVDRQVAERVLRRLGYRVVTVKTAEDAISESARRSFDLILMDCRLPGLSGYRAAAEIRDLEAVSKSDRTPIVGVSASTSVRVESKCQRSGMDAFLEKPISERLLRRALLSSGLAQDL